MSSSTACGWQVSRSKIQAPRTEQVFAIKVLLIHREASWVQVAREPYPRGRRKSEVPKFLYLAMIDNYHLTRENATFRFVILRGICGEEDFRFLR
jgi:hypothetical protein